MIPQEALEYDVSQTLSGGVLPEPDTLTIEQGIPPPVQIDDGLNDQLSLQVGTSSDSGIVE
jgi:hypothetical protein